MLEKIETVALVGHPNSGKSTLFNSLTGSQAKVGNYAGVTVSVKRGDFFTPHGRKMHLLDLPGCYSLSGGSPEQTVTQKAILEGDENGVPDLIIHVADASALERHLQMTFELIELGKPMILALNMVDVAQAQGIRIEPALLSERLGIPVVYVQANRRTGVLRLRQAIRHPLPSAPHAKKLTAEERATAANELCCLAARRPSEETLLLSDRIDSWCIHPVWGWLIFSAVMLLFFWSIFFLAQVPMVLIENAQTWLQEKVTAIMQAGELRELLTQGIIGGAGSTIIFLPQILLLFFFITLLESSGYMARAAYLMDGVMNRVGLSGKAFLPLLSSYACAIPGIMATRTIDSAKERMITIFIAPWMSCSARLPVYLLIVPMLTKNVIMQTFIMIGVYAAGTLAALFVAKILHKKLGAENDKALFLLEFPPYRLPQFSYVVRNMLERAWEFVKQAGGIILAISVILWALQTYPRSSSSDPAIALENSYMGRLSHVIEPIVKPMGHDGKTGTAILTSFAAREVFVSSMNIVHNVGADESAQDKLDSIKWADGRKMFTPLSLVSLLIFFIYALQCLPTSALVARESGSWKWAVAQFLFMSIFAWSAAVIVYQIGRLIF